MFVDKGRRYIHVADVWIVVYSNELDGFPINNRIEIFLEVNSMDLLKFPCNNMDFILDWFTIVK